MAIEGLARPEQPPVPREFTDDIAIAADIIVNRLGLDTDYERVTEQVAADFKGLEGSGETGEPYIWLPTSVVTPTEMVAALDRGPYPKDKGYPETYVYPSLWVPGAHPNAYTEAELGNLERGKPATNVPPHARLAVHNPESDYDPLLHFEGLSFDEIYAEKGQETQLDALAKAKAEYETATPGFNLNPLNVMGVAWIAYARRLKGEPMPLRSGWMRDATLERKTVDGGSYVGDVYSNEGLLRLDRSDGNARLSGGVGVSVGQNQLETQAS